MKRTPLFYTLLALVLLAGVTVGTPRGQFLIRAAVAAVTTSTYTAQYDRATDAIFLKKIEQGILTAAVAILAEADTGVLWHQRKALAIAVLASPTAMAAVMSRGIATNVALSDSSTDSDIQFTINSMWDAYSYGR